MLKRIIVNNAKKIMNNRRLKSLHCVDKKIAEMHPEWEELDSEEKKYMLLKSDYEQFKAFKSIRGKVEKGYVSDGAYQLLILPKLHKMDYQLNREIIDGNLFFDKNYFDMFLQILKGPDVVMRNVEGTYLDGKFKVCKDCLDVLNQYDQLVFKKSLGTGHGRGVKLVERKDYKKELKLFEADFVIQKVLKQSDYLAKFNKSSVNVIRITTLNWKNEIYILGGVLRVGVPGEFCDHTTSRNGEHPRIIGISDDGRLMTDRIVDPDAVKVCDDLWGKIYENEKIPLYAQMIRLVKMEHEHFPHHKIIGWDLTLDSNENIICIEYNAYTPGIIQTQYVLGPIFALKTKNGNTLLDEIINAN